MIDFWSFATFAVLGVAILALWVNARIALSVLAAAVAIGYVSRVLTGPAVLWIALLAFACHRYSISNGAMKFGMAVLIAALSLGLGLHVLPGFHNPHLVYGAVFSADAEPYDLYLNFDKTLFGVIFIALAYRPLIVTRDALFAALKSATPFIVANIGAAMLLSFALGYIRFDPHWTPVFWWWAFSNLFLTCLSEEAFFRGFIQRGVTQALGTNAYASAIGLAIGAVLFGVAHFAGGWRYVALATAAGFGYGFVFQRTRRLEMSILAHFALNTTHFLLFTYPRLAQSV